MKSLNNPKTPTPKPRKLSKQRVVKFQEKIWEHYKKNKRDLPWRETHDPYRILVSEIMLQQTQVSRVRQKYAEFLKLFPTLKSLSVADQRSVLKAWQGLGYNRRALNLKRTAEVVMKKYKGKMPKDRDELETLPGIGQSTSGALMNFSYEIPAAFIETNIRAVFLYFFFKGSSSVSDKDIYALVGETMDGEQPREWFYALYDYGAMLKTKLGKDRTKLHQQSKHYNKQSAFEGSNRQIRSLILKCLLTSKKWMPAKDIAVKIERQIEDVKKNLPSLEKEGFVIRSGERWKI